MLTMLSRLSRRDAPRRGFRRRIRTGRARGIGRVPMVPIPWQAMQLLVFTMFGHAVRLLRSRHVLVAVGLESDLRSGTFSIENQ